MRLVCFHGSPGSPLEFQLLQKELRKLLPGIQVEAMGRGGSSKKNRPELRDKWILGYSWGAAEALLKVLESDEPIAGFIFVAPYLFPKKKLSRFARGLLRTPGVSSLLLWSLAKKTIEEFLERSSAPFAPPQDYEELARTFKNPRVLRTAALEKESFVKEEKIKRSLSLLAAKGGRKHCPIWVIWGTQDVISEENFQIEPLRKIFPWIQEFRIEGAGHALQWTHPTPLAAAIVQILSDGETRV